jgi:hypothetical protein
MVSQTIVATMIRKGLAEGYNPCCIAQYVSEKMFGLRPYLLRKAKYPNNKKWVGPGYVPCDKCVKDY